MCSSNMKWSFVFLFFSLRHLQCDLIAGLTVGLTVIPQGLAYAKIAGLPPQVYMLMTQIIFPNVCFHCQYNDNYCKKKMLLTEGKNHKVFPRCKTQKIHDIHLFSIFPCSMAYIQLSWVVLFTASLELPRTLPWDQLPLCHL